MKRKYILAYILVGLLVFTAPAEGSLWKVLTARWGSGAGEVDQVRIDASTNTLQTIEYEHHEIHDGSHYFVVGYQELTAGDVLQFTWVMPDTTKWTHWVWDIDCEAETQWYVYEAGVIDSALANSITPLNSNRNSGNASGTIMRFENHANIGDANDHVDVSGATLLGSGIAGSGKKIGGNSSRINELILKQDTIYVMRAVEVSPGYINFNMQWYEHQDKH